MNPQDPEFRQQVENAIDIGQLWARLGLPQDPLDWQHEDSQYVQSIFADKKELVKALGFENARCLTPEEAAREAEDRSTKLFEHWTLLRNILDRFEAILRKRWMKKSQEQRKKILLDAWPNMSPLHRPDFWAFRRESEEQRQAGTQFRDAYMWPNINLEDLCKGKTLLLLLNSRGRHGPAVFAFADLESIHVGQFSKALQGAFLTTHDMVLQGNSPATYGKIVQAIDMDDIARMVEGKSFNAGDGLDVLEIQERILGFLVTCCRIILQDKGANLTDESIPTLQEPPPLKSDGVEWRSTAALAAEAPYVVPRQADLTRLKALISARLSDAEDHIWALREDPAYFSNVVGDWSEHSSEMILDERKKQHPDVTNLIRKRKFWDRTLGNIVYNAYEEIFLWHFIQQQLDELITLDRAFTETGFQYEEEYPEYLTALQKLKYFIEKRLTNFYLMRLNTQLPASPPIRSYFQRLPNPDDYYGYSVYPRSGDLGSSKDDLLWLFAQYSDEMAIQIAGLENLAGELERLIQNDPRQKERITPLVAKIFSDIGLVGELQNQLRTYRPRIFLKRGNKFLAAQEKDLEDWGSDLIRPIWNLMRILDEKAGGIRLGEDGDPTTGRFYYPANKRRSKESNDAMQSAERHLDAFWAKFDEELRSRIDMPSYILLQRMVPSDRQLQRTEDWVELENPGVQSTAHQPVADYISKHNLELEKRTRDTITPEAPIATKTKIKTRGIPQPPISEQSQQVHKEKSHEFGLDQQPTFVLKKRAFKVFSTLFHEPNSQEQPGEIPWSDFLYAMVSTGFVPEKLYGSVWQFTPTNLDVERSIHFHEPHPHGKIPFIVARRYGRRLNRAYGWVRSVFVLA